eukprot:352191-Chlamydomonas_euryale.AAC.2
MERQADADTWFRVWVCIGLHGLECVNISHTSPTASVMDHVGWYELVYDGTERAGLVSGGHETI